MKFETKLEKLSKKKKEVVKLVLKGFSKKKILTQISKKRNVTPEQKNSYRAILAHITMAILWVKLNKVVALPPKELKLKEKAVLKDWSEGKSKQILRDTLEVEVVNATKKNNHKPILTLSADMCITELQLHKRNELKDCKFLSCELEPVVFESLVKNIYKNNWTFMQYPLPFEIGKLINISVKDMYSHLFLDFCQSLKEHYHTIETALKNNIVSVGGVVWITVSTHIGGTLNKGYNTKTELLNLVKKYNNYEIKFKMSYSDSSPMYSVILKRTK